MAFSIVHAFSSLKSDGVDVSLVQPSNWNASHTINMDAYTLIGRRSGAGAGSGIPWSEIQPPLGCILPYAASTLPDASWLFPNGQAINRITYLDLFTKISTTYGVGDGSTTFNLPDCRGNVLAGLDNLGGVSSANRLNTFVASTTLGALGGAQSDTASVSVSGTVVVGGSTAGSLSVTSNIVSGFSIVRGANGTDGPNVVQDGATASIVGSTSGALSVSASGGNAMTGNTASVTNVQPTLMMNFIMKCLFNP
jgi:microcystin-dependent protein